MTNRRAMELLMIDRACVRRGSGMDYSCDLEGYIKVHEECSRDCAHCELVQKAEELLEMYDLVIGKMIEETEKEEKEEARTFDLREWQRNCDPRAGLAI